MSRTNKKALLEAALFMSNESLSKERLSKIVRSEPEVIARLLDEIKMEYDGEEHGVHLFEAKDGYQLRVKPEFVNQVRSLTPMQDLSRGLLRVLALVAYKQPITQSDIVKVIGNRTYEYIKILTTKGLLRAAKHGRTKALFVTKEFAEYFGLESPDDAKKLFEQMSMPENKEVKTDEGNEQPGTEAAGEGTGGD